MAQPRASSTQPYMKSDEIRLDTSKAPWMEFAKAELGKKVHEITENDSFLNELRMQLGIGKQLSELGEDIASLGEGSMLLGDGSQRDYSLYAKGKAPKLRDSATGLVGQMSAAKLKANNPEITKYFSDVKSDPAYDPKKKGRSWDIAPTYAKGQKSEVTPWCAAFVNWCLGQAGAPRLGYATARSWLELGTPVSHPVYGCITIIKPSSDTGSTTGHVAFFVETVGEKVKLLGGNQVRGTRVSESNFLSKNVIGYRWPTKINHYLLAGGVQA